MLNESSAAYLVGCDGGRSFTRKAAGIELTDLGFDQPWLVVDTTLKPGETRESANVPFVHRQYCNPAQPIAYIPSGVKGHFRWEFMLAEDATREKAEAPDNVRRLLSLVVDPDKFEIDRAAVYSFHSLVAQEMRRGRIMLAGDAAHQMPPFAGQGLCCGLRDAHNLAWKLALVLKGSSDAALLDSYNSERIPHVTRMTRGTMLLGNLVQTQSRLRAWVRDMLFKTVFKIPAVYGRLARFALRPPDIQTGVLGSLRPKAAGTRFPQPMVCTQQQADQPILLDELLGNGFSLITRRPELIDKLDGLFEAVAGQTVLILDQGNKDWPESAKASAVILSNQTLGAWLDKYDADAVVIRPDRYVFDACRLREIDRLSLDLQQKIRLTQRFGEP